MRDEGQRPWAKMRADQQMPTGEVHIVMTGARTHEHQALTSSRAVSAKRFGGCDDSHCRPPPSAFVERHHKVDSPKGLATRFHHGRTCRRFAPGGRRPNG
jgi:hypothetical protein